MLKKLITALTPPPKHKAAVTSTVPDQTESTPSPSTALPQCITPIIKEKTKEKTKVLLLDFDLTLTRAHLYSMLKQDFPTPYPYTDYGTVRLISQVIFRKEGQAIFPVINDKFKNMSETCPARESEQMAALIRSTLAKGHKVAIASFTLFPHAIPLFLEAQLGLSDKELEQIIIVGGFPSEGPEDNKNEHIAHVKAIVERESDIRISTSDMLLVDDTERNIIGARSIGCNAMHVPVGEKINFDALQSFFDAPRSAARPSF